MWPDNETTLDLIGFKVHADLIREVIIDPTLLPTVIGVFGDWGGGKSSIMKMLANDLARIDDEHLICLTFNGWVFEGYEDAKTALLSSILVQLAEHKRIGLKLRDRLTSLFKRVKWMEVAKLGVKHVGVPLAGYLLAGQTSVGTAVPLVMPDPSTINWGSLVNAESEEATSDKPELLEVRKFRDEFEQLLADTDIQALVVLIDDLDRCLPERIVETLEAIKLFMAVPKTAFVIGADPRIVRHAIAKRYAEKQLRTEDTTQTDLYDLITDYLEKLIQIPYYLPRLSPAELETYINLLFCHKGLDPDIWKVIENDWSAKQANNYYAAYRAEAIDAVVGSAKISSELKQRLAWSAAVAPVITEGLKGNPRQIKRMLNALLLREKLAKVASIQIKEEVLAKLMVLEYTNLARFHDLYAWQAAESGHPAKLKALEQSALASDQWNTVAEGELKPWHTPSLQNWLQMEPSLSEIDLRDYFWLARDHTRDMLVGVQMIPPLLRRLFEDLISDNEGEQNIAVAESKRLSENDREILLQLLHQEALRHPDQDEAFSALFRLANSGVKAAAQALFSTVTQVAANDLLPNVSFNIQQLAQVHTDLQPQAIQVLQKVAQAKETPAGKAATKALEGLRDGNI